MNALIIDDERLARSELRRLLAAHPEITIAGEAANAAEARRQCDALRPDLLFLDIQMPEEDGFQFLESLEEVPLVIFTTAYDQHALKAFEVNALDYLLKPVLPARLAAALARLPRTTDRKPDSSVPSSPIQHQIFVKDGERCWFVNVSDIALFESEGNYTRLYFGQNRPLLARSLNYLEERLDPALFFRANRRHIVNLRRIASLDPSIAGGFLVKLKEGIEIEMSRRQSQKFKELMSV